MQEWTGFCVPLVIEAVFLPGRVRFVALSHAAFIDPLQ